MARSLSRKNNFDLIRLIAALQVVLWHSNEHLHYSSKLLTSVIASTRFFPGVPIFFTVSGFLVFGSFERNKQITKYLKNRCLRIFPALWVVFVFTLLILSITGIINSSNILSTQIIIWSITQISIFQFYTPDLLRSFGNGTPNGSLWTIFIEFSFYIFVPIIFKLAKKGKMSRSYLIIIFFFISLIYNYWYGYTYKFQTGYQSNTVKFLGLNLVPYLFYFLGGAFIYEHWEKLKILYVNKGLFWLAAYVLYYVVFSIWLKKYEPNYWPNIWGTGAILLLAQTTISLAYTNVGLSDKILNHNDISYGLYLFHMPIVNTLLFYGFKFEDISLFLLLVVVIPLAYFSWKTVEKPALSLKNNSPQNNTRQ